MAGRRWSSGTPSSQGAPLSRRDGFTTVADDYNLDASDTCNMSGTELRGVDPLLGPLADNGGPTQTRMPHRGARRATPAIPVWPGAVASPARRRPARRPAACGTALRHRRLRRVANRDHQHHDEHDHHDHDHQHHHDHPLRPAPHAGCQPALGQKSKLTLKNLADDTKDRLSWSWTSSDRRARRTSRIPWRGRPTTWSASTTREACGSTRRRPPVGRAGRDPAGSEPPALKFIYTDKLLDPDGLLKVVLKPGPAAGKAKITVKGKGPNLGLPALPLTTPVRMQTLQRFGQFPQFCWEASFSASTRNDAQQFSARSDP